MHKIRHRSDKGFTLIELLVALAISSLLMAAVYTLYLTFYKQTAAQDLLIEAQQSARAGIEFVQKDIALTGHMVPSSEKPISSASANSITFRYRELSGAVYKYYTVTYAVDSESGVYYLKRRKCEHAASNWSSSCAGSSGDYQRIVENLSGSTGLALSYYDRVGNPMAFANATSTSAIRFVKVDLTAKTEILPTTGATKTIRVSTEVKLRNVGLTESSSADTTSPSQPLNLEVREATLSGRTGICGRLAMRWDKGTEGDLVGYKVFYTIGAATMNVTVPISQLTESGGDYYYTLAPTDNPLSCNVQYAITIRAYDSSNNFSTQSSEISGNPTPSNATFGSGAQDTTITPSKPTAVTGFAGQDGTTEGQVTLSWSAYDTTNNPDVVGFRIYRSTEAFNTYPIVNGGQGGKVTWIAGSTEDSQFGAANQLSKTATSFTDTGPNLIGCQVYYYAIVPVTSSTTCSCALALVEADYAKTNGDGASGSATDTPSGSDTAPNETTPPGAPTVGARAGWRRVAISVTNPTTADFSRTCAYVEKGGTSGQPTLNDTKDANSCFNVANALSGTRGLVPDASPDSNPNGIFSNSSPVSFWHDSMTDRTPSEPTLAQAGQEVQSYAYRAVSFDRCGNPRTLAEATSATAVATTNLCGEDPTSGEKPPAPAVPATPMSGCEAPSTTSNVPLKVSWTPVSSDVNFLSSVTNPWDLAGYRIYRSTSTDFSSATLLNATAPYWCEGTCGYTDNSVSEGTAYYYKVAATDCPYEKDNPGQIVGKLLSDMNSNTIHATTAIGPFVPGRIGRDEKCSGAGSCSKDLHREILTGTTLDASNNSVPTTSPSAEAYRHHTVAFFLENTSMDTGVSVGGGKNGGDMTIQRATVTWTNAGATLTKVTIGGGRSGIAASSTTLSSSSGTDNDLTDVTIPGGKRYVPIIFEFKDVSSNPIDMRDDEVNITLSIKNESTGSTTCVSYPTTAGTSQAIVVPLGVRVSTVTQSNPAATSAYAVPPNNAGPNTVPNGSYGSVVATGSQTVPISAYVISNTTDEDTGNKIGISSVKLYYAETALTDTDAADGTPASYTDVTMNSVGGNLYTYSIPAVLSPPKRVWFYIIAVDADGNYDRAPEIGEGYYTYDQKPFNVCDYTPNPPVLTSVTPSGTQATLGWTAPTQYTAGTTIPGGAGGDTIKYKIYRITGGITTDVASDVAGTSYTETGLTDNTVHSYYLKATNSCASPGANVSGASNQKAACIGSSGYAVISVSGTDRDASTAGLQIYKGDSYTATVFDCLAANGSYATTTETLNVTSGFSTFYNQSANGSGYYAPSVTESGPAAAEFIKTVTTGGAADSPNLVVGGTDTITAFYSYASPQTATLSIIEAPCDNAPAAPTGLAGVVGPTTGPSSERNRYVDLSWTASSSFDRARYKIYRKSGAGGAYASVGEAVSSASGTITYRDEAGRTNIANNDYYYKLTTVDSCPLESTGYSNEIGPF